MNDLKIFNLNKGDVVFSDDLGIDGPIRIQTDPKNIDEFYVVDYIDVKSNKGYFGHDYSEAYAGPSFTFTYMPNESAETLYLHLYKLNNKYHGCCVINEVLYVAYGDCKEELLQFLNTGGKATKLTSPCGKRSVLMFNYDEAETMPSFIIQHITDHLITSNPPGLTVDEYDTYTIEEIVHASSQSFRIDRKLFG